MTKEEALKLIDAHKNNLVDPVAMLQWTWVRLIILNVDADQWERACGKAAEIAAK